MRQRPSIARVPLVLLLVGAAVTPAHAKLRPGLEAHLGAAWNAPAPLVVRQDGEPDLRLTARYVTRALEAPLYYAARVMLLEPDGRGWALDLVHHKLHLEDPPPEIAEFAVSHGYNLLVLSRLRAGRPWHWGAGAGVVVAHPENTVRGRRLDERRGLLGGGYYVAGAALGASVGRRLPLPGALHLAGEARATLSWARVPVAGGSADVPDLALHVSLGLGWVRGGLPATRRPRG